MDRATDWNEGLRGFARLIVCTAILSSAQLARADTLNLGFISFDGFIPGSVDSPGVNEFSINNFTGDPGLGGFALPPDFPVFNFRTFKDAQLILQESTGPEVFALGDLGSGTATSDLVTASMDILSAQFSATLDQTTLQLADGSTFVAGSVLIQATLLPSSPPSLGTGDFVLITASGTPAAVPEPASVWLLVICSLPLIRKRINLF